MFLMCIFVKNDVFFVGKGIFLNLNVEVYVNDVILEIFNNYLI